MCGEHISPIFLCGGVQGSSPHVRGARNPAVHSNRQAGIIPACAGSTRPPTSNRDGGRDHPRMCGEHCTETGRQLWSQGSSPHVRGALAKLFTDALNGGIIPACAGSTRTVVMPMMRSRDHPRMCGEHTSMIGFAAMTAGSSPHVRGALEEGLFVVRGLGIIPACAGSTVAVIGARAAARDHPRMCGEHISDFALEISSAGSSPHVRGARSPARALTSSPGIIPACAGSTCCCPVACLYAWDHPRMCGEHPIPDHLGRVGLGSSPHVRGARRVHA